MDIKNVKKALGDSFFNKLEEVRFKKGKEFFLTEAHFILDGTIEVFIMDYENTGEYIKVGNLNNKNCFIGFHSYFKEDFLKGVYERDLDVFYRSKSDVILIKFPDYKLKVIFDSNIKFLKIAMKIFYDRMIKINSLFLFRATSSKEEVVKNILERESENSGGVKLDNIVDLVDSHKINRSTFYKSINTLVETGIIRKEKKVIKFTNK